MWDNAPLLRTIASALTTFSVLAMLFGATWYAVHLPGLLPLHSVRLSAAPQRINAPDVLRVVRHEVQGNFFTVDIGRLRASLEKLPWVRSVTIRREFPDRLAVEFEEHRAVARWNNSALVNQQGEVFVAESEQNLPGFIGQEGTSLEVMQHYALFSQQLAQLNESAVLDCSLHRERGRVGVGDSVHGTCSDVNLQVAQLALSPRHAWQLRLNNGLVLELGREDMQQRLARFVAVYPYSLAAMQGAVKYVDLRYHNGFAVGGIIKS
ncbi:MAG: FtsQ-type POTRA domain-containing protein [Gallionella sp.]|nr:MAG: FtsQ-type POTRA domain-containing protein [Gallionella sp.]